MANEAVYKRHREGERAGSESSASLYMIIVDEAVMLDASLIGSAQTK